ncbi:enoyl-CoA hydratase-related protein [Thermococcus barophilus]|uniref:Enoyl-CoA hydratase domain-containing protein 3, mitochondrial n=1 Tax=Thermococcus barophilus TaxID=55802 RepID=A0A0S1X8A2_THEBA|nr:enoyl-CoA hydratase-related protein [Thermococcus barophilus]ALM73995.1 Enoyl-CoA hydratase [Thermococcus barophilus]
MLWENDVIYEEKEDIGIITLNRPEKRNALSKGMLSQLADILYKIANERRVKVVIIKGTGKCFSSGHDLKEILSSDLHDAEETFDIIKRVMIAIREAPQPVIAQVHGYALAAGCQLVAACDLAVASEETKFALSGINVGLFCFTPTVFVSRNIAPKRAFELAFTGDMITAQEALKWGLINKVVPREKLEEETMALAKRLARHSLSVLEAGKKFFYRQLDLSWEDALECATKTIILWSQRKEVKKGITAFLEKK